MRSTPLSAIPLRQSLAEDGMGLAPDVASDDKLFRLDAIEAADCSVE